MYENSATCPTTDYVDKNSNATLLDQLVHVYKKITAIIYKINA